MDVTTKELEAILKYKTNKGATVIQQNSRFVGYSARVTSHQDVRQVYKKIKMCQPNARHVVCAYSIEGHPEYYGNDFHDDGEPGAGRQILKYMTDENIKNTAIFVARRYGGVRMGPDRFECYVEAAKASLTIKEIPSNNDASPTPAPKKKPRIEVGNRETAEVRNDESNTDEDDNKIPVQSTKPVKKHVNHQIRGRSYNPRGRPEQRPTNLPRRESAAYLPKSTGATRRPQRRPYFYHRQAGPRYHRGNPRGGYSYDYMSQTEDWSGPYNGAFDRMSQEDVL